MNYYKIIIDNAAMRRDSDLLDALEWAELKASDGDSQTPGLVTNVYKVRSDVLVEFVEVLEASSAVHSFERIRGIEWRDEDPDEDWPLSFPGSDGSARVREQYLPEFPVEVTVTATGRVAPYGFGEIVERVTVSDKAELIRVVGDASSAGHNATLPNGEHAELHRDGSVYFYEVPTL